MDAIVTETQIELIIETSYSQGQRRQMIMFRSFNICQREMTDRSKNSSMQAQRFDGTKIAVFDQSMSIQFDQSNETQLD